MGRVLLFVGCCVVLSACSAYVPEKVTADGLLTIKPGMTYGELETLIGPPVCVVSIEDSSFNEADKKMADAVVRDCVPSQRSTRSVPPKFREAAELSLSYAEPRASFTNPNIYVHLKVGRVAGVYIKKDDYGVCCMDGLPTSPFYGGGSRELLRELVGR